MKKMINRIHQFSQSNAMHLLRISFRNKLFVLAIILVLYFLFIWLAPGLLVIDAILQIASAWMFGFWGVVSMTLGLIIGNYLFRDSHSIVDAVAQFPSIIFITLSGFGLLTLFLRNLIIRFRSLSNSIGDFERRYQALFERSQDMVFIVGLDQRILAVNQIALDLFGYAEEELVGELVSKIISPDELQQAESNVGRLLNDSALSSYERTFIKKDGTILIGEITPSVVYDAEGEPAFFQSIIRDITKRKEIEQRLRYSENLYKNFMKHTRDSIVLFDDEGIVFEINEYGAELLGRTVEEMIGVSMAVFAAPEEQEQAMDVLQRIFSGEILPPYERTNIANDGREFILSISISLVTDENGEPLYVQSIARDITKQKILEERLRYSENLYKNFMKHTRDSINLFDLEGTIFEINEYGAALMGGTVEEMKGKTMADFAIPEELEASKRSFEHILSGAVVPPYERTNITLDGKEVVLSVNITLVTNEDGDPLYVQSIARDVSDQKLLNQQLFYLATHDQLTGALNRRALSTELQQAIQKSRDDKTKLAIFFIDLDKFKPVNDRFGHAMGDHVLLTISERLSTMQGAEDLFSRVGGDEFVWVKAGFKNTEELQDMAQRFLESIEKTVTYAGLSANISASIGIAIYPDDGELVDQLMIHADQAMYHAKEGRSSKIFFWKEFMGK